MIELAEFAQEAEAGTGFIKLLAELVAVEGDCPRLPSGLVDR